MITEAITQSTIPTIPIILNIRDEEMLGSVGMGIAMGNAPEDIKKIAKDVTNTNNQDGIFKALQKLHII